MRSLIFSQIWGRKQMFHRQTILQTKATYRSFLPELNNHRFKYFNDKILGICYYSVVYKIKFDQNTSKDEEFNGFNKTWLWILIVYVIKIHFIHQKTLKSRSIQKRPWNIKIIIFHQSTIFLRLPLVLYINECRYIVAR